LENVTKMALNIPWYKLQQYFWSLFGVLGIVMFWAGIWDGVGSLYYLQPPLVSLAFGLFILIVSGVIFKELNPFGKSGKKMIVAIHKVRTHSKRHQFHFKYFDKIKNKYLLISASKLKTIEKDAYLILKDGGKEVIIPVHRVKGILHQGKAWDHKKEASKKK
jgi:hypothetical protein